MSSFIFSICKVKFNYVIQIQDTQNHIDISDEEDNTISDKYNVNIQLMSIIIIIKGCAYFICFSQIILL